jgi:pimeloyl-ACP methyl ester carboxylesterase
MKHIYIFSGLGVDERVFKNLNFTGFEITFIKWLKPDSNEGIEDYAKRLIIQINTENPVLIGLSFGGMVAMEVAKLITTEKIILIASAKSFKQIPYYYRWAGYLKFHKLLPAKLLKKHSFISNWAFGVDVEKDRILLREILKDLDSNFLKWAIDKIVCWKNFTVPSNIIHIHGDDDRILPIRFVNPDFLVKNGGHFMTVNKSKEITELLHKLLL